MEAPHIYAAIDALAVRAGKWAERRQRLLLEALPEDSGLPSPESAAAAAIAAVKEVACVFPSGLQGACSFIWSLASLTIPSPCQHWMHQVNRNSKMSESGPRPVIWARAQTPFGPCARLVRGDCSRLAVAVQMTNAASESAKAEIVRKAAQEAKAAEDAAAKAALVRDFPSLQPNTPSPAPAHRKTSCSSLLLYSYSVVFFSLLSFRHTYLSPLCVYLQSVP
jgi:hypothetical protein